MNRKDFFKNLGLITAGIAVAPTVMAEMVETNKKHKYLISTDFEIDYQSKNIRHIGGHHNDGGITVLQLYRFLKNEWEKE